MESRKTIQQNLCKIHPNLLRKDSFQLGEIIFLLKLVIYASSKQRLTKFYEPGKVNADRKIF